MGAFFTNSKQYGSQTCLYCVVHGPISIVCSSCIRLDQPGSGLTVALIRSAGHSEACCRHPQPPGMVGFVL